MPQTVNTITTRRTPRLLAPALIMFTLIGCSPFNYTATDAPVALSSVPLLEPRPRIALVLGAGGPRGYAHIGVLRALEAHCIDVDLMVGTSVGALLAAFWGSGLSAAEIDQLSTQGGPLTLFDPSPFADRGWIHGRKLQNYVNRELGDIQLQELPRRVVIATTRRSDKSEAYFTSGNIGVAVRASSAVPNIISPVGINGVEFEDGDVSAPLAVSAARSAGSEFIIAVNVYPHSDSAPSNASERSLKQLARRERQIAQQITEADFVIHAATPFRASPRRKFFNASRDIGEQVARLRMPELLRALRQHGITMPPKECG
jgi:NTE family protein